MVSFDHKRTNYSLFFKKYKQKVLENLELFIYTIFKNTIPIIHIIIETTNHIITEIQNFLSQNFKAIEPLTKLFDITAIIIVIAASSAHTFQSTASTAIV